MCPLCRAATENRLYDRMTAPLFPLLTPLLTPAAGPVVSLQISVTPAAGPVASLQIVSGSDAGLGNRHVVQLQPHPLVHTMPALTCFSPEILTISPALLLLALF